MQGENRKHLAVCTMLVWLVSLTHAAQSVGLLYVAQMIVHLICISVNPADPNVLCKMETGKTKVPNFDRAHHKHVIEDQHCYLCNVDVYVLFLP